MRSVLRCIRPGYVLPVCPVVQSGYMSYIAFLPAHTNLAQLHRPNQQGISTCRSAAHFFGTKE